ncbi:SGNH/GDSL hydrolase family protein [Roseovarius aestuariivivens]|uniref:SGNH/GDSL hydrolase family protein n=1 Tax=Roseovarius aestuariivivens TaxID=1888910 RepID=UPI00107FFE03|nr:SGNH/GDSL hydrolase family protein [Roseovarius aestuariivivens]
MFRSLVLAAALCLPNVLSATTLSQFSDVVVFGDSLSDPVNPLPPALYPNGQVTNGDNWAVQLGLADPTSNNFAMSAATAKTDGPDDFAEQIGLFSGTGQTLGDSAMAAVWFGGNDIADALLSGTGVARIGEAIQAMASGLDQLAQAGFDKALVFLAPDVGDTPRIQAVDAVQPGAAALATSLTGLFNAQLLNVASLMTETLEMAFVDIPSLVLATKSSPASFGFTNVVDPCVVNLVFVNGCSLATANEYLYYDSFHPSERAHGLIADAALSTASRLAPVPLPAGLVLLLTALAGLGATTRIRRTA